MTLDEDVEKCKFDVIQKEVKLKLEDGTQYACPLCESTGQCKYVNTIKIYELSKVDENGSKPIYLPECLKHSDNVNMR